MDLRLQARKLEAAVLIEIGGEIDLHSAPQLRAALLKGIESFDTPDGGTDAENEGAKSENAGAAPRVVVDLSGVSFVDSTGVGVLVGALKRAREKGGELHFCGAQTRVKRVFEITGLLNLLPLFDSRDAALARWSEDEAAEDAAAVGAAAEDQP